MRLSKRIYALADKVIGGDSIADIGTDHGYVPMLLMRQGKSPHVIMSDISEASLTKARETFKIAGIKADENDYTEGTFKSYINQANALADINVYYDGKSTKHASIRLEPFREEGWYQTYWTAEPVLVFYSDGSSYSTFEAFFNQSEFKRTINTFKTLANAYANIIGQQIDW